MVLLALTEAQWTDVETWVSGGFVGLGLLVFMGAVMMVTLWRRS